MKIVIIDGQGGRIGAALAEALHRSGRVTDLTVIGTNSLATSAMMKAGGCPGATGENPVVVACSDADMILGPVGILSANALLGEITPKMAQAVSESRADKLLIPVNRCRIRVAGTGGCTMSELVDETVREVLRLSEEN